MPRKEKFGKFVLLEEVETSGLGAEYRAAKLGSAGLEKIVSVLRLGASVSSHPEAPKNLMEQAKFAAQLQNPNVLKIFGIGKVDASYYISYEFVEGKSLKAIFSRCRQEGFPFSVDHTLLIASKICSALEYAHSRKLEGGGRYFHGLLTPGSVLVSYEGEVRLRGFGYWPSRVKEAGALGEEEVLYLSPEQAAGGAGDTRSDTFSVGAILFETLTGQPLFQGGRSQDVPPRITQAKLQSPSSDDDSLPKPIADILKRSLAVDAAGRYAEIQEMRKAIDTLLFSGDFTPTTFNLAFFMHSLFREDIERESKLLKEEKESSYIEFLTEEPKAAPARPGTPTPLPVPHPPPVTTAGHPTPAPKSETVPMDLRSIREEAAHREIAAHPTHPSPHPAAHPPAHTEPAISAKEAAAGFTFHKDEHKSKAPLFAGIGAVVLIVAAAAYFGLGLGGPPAPTTAPATQAPATLSLEAAAALARVKELEEKLAAIEAEKKAAETKAADDARRKVEAQAAAKGQTVDPAAVAKAQEDAARRARVEQEKKAAEEQRKLEDAKKAEEGRLAEEQRRAEEQRKADEAAKAAAAAAAAPTPPPTTVPAAPAMRPGTLVNLSDPGVIAPVVERAPQPLYPPLALRQRAEGTVELNVLVDEKGQVTDAQVVTGAGGKMGLNEAAVDAVRKRKYRPATKEGVPVKVWMAVRIEFKLPR